MPPWEPDPPQVYSGASASLVHGASSRESVARTAAVDRDPLRVYSEAGPMAGNGTSSQESVAGLAALLGGAQAESPPTTPPRSPGTCWGCWPGVLLALLVVWTLLGNGLVCAAVLGSRPLRAKVTNLFIASLAISDLLVALLVMPWAAAAEVAGYWPFGAFCDIWVAFDIMCSTASILHLCVISLDRYWAIASPFRYERRMTPRLALAMVGTAWALALLISFVPVQLHWHKGSQAHPSAPGPTLGPTMGPTTSGAEGPGTPWMASTSSGSSNATLMAQRCDASLNRTYAISSSLISFYIPVAIMIVTYTRIYRIAQVQIRRISSLERAAEHAQSCRSSNSKHLDCCTQHHHQHHHPSLKSSIRKETKVLKTLSVIMGVFVCCWLPFFVLNCMVPFCQSAPNDPKAGLPCVSDTTFNVFVWFGWANSSLNPIIYAFNADFRKVFSHLLGCSQHCSSTPVETVNLSNELISYNQDTLFHQEMATAYVNMIPHTVRGRQEEDPFDHMSQISPDPEGATDLVCDLDCEGDISLDKITPFTSSYLL